MLNNMWKRLVERVELQSIIVLILTLGCGIYLIRIDNSLDSPAGILGSISVAMGLLYTYGSFFSNSIRENYKDVISEYKTTILEQRSGGAYLLGLKKAENEVPQTLSGYSMDPQDQTLNG